MTLKLKKKGEQEEADDQEAVGPGARAAHLARHCSHAPFNVAHDAHKTKHTEDQNEIEHVDVVQPCARHRIT